MINNINNNSNNTFWSSGSHTMTVILTTTNEPYTTTKSPPTTTHLILNACEALCCPSLCEARDLKDGNRQVPWAPGVFSWRQLTAATCLELRKQKSLFDALDGSYFAVWETYAMDLMGRRSWWLIVEASKLVIRKPPGAWHPHDVGFHPTGGDNIPSIPFL